ncbi:hypothetical protein EVAR_77677_1 [Eumeta japonica]|uniref:Uncharacterized protein n=1 Tax=Eumeta variegata TaxID=151549 RepID=A0A4C2AAA2_EUMVA|nr:hypothetical protein EVAR_77677_1 [Eumeta japonica]
MRFQKVGPAMEPCIQPLEVSLLDSPQRIALSPLGPEGSLHHAKEVHREIIGERLGLHRRLSNIIKGILRPALRHEAILRRLQLRHQVPLEAPTSILSTVLPSTGAGLWAGRGKYPSSRHLFAIARNTPRSRKIAAWHMSDVNPSMPGPFEDETP